MRRMRTIYFNDARHYYLFVFEPPMDMKDAWRPIDDIVGTGVDTFSYGVERTDGLFYPSKYGMMFGADKHPFTDAYAWRTWGNMNSLIERGLDPLRVLIDRAHDKGIEFWASLRMAGYGGIPEEFRLEMPESWKQDEKLKAAASNIWAWADFAIPEVRDHQFAVLQELATEYPTDGIELDFIFTAHYFKPEETKANLPVMTDYVRKISEMVRGRPGGPGVIGARVLPTEEMCLDGGLDVRTWLKEGLLDFVIPMWYYPFTLDCNFPVEWIVEAAHDANVAVYGCLNPWYRDETSRRFYNIEPASLAMMRAAASNYFDRGVDGLYTWFLKWPLGDTERRILTEIGDPELVQEGVKHYFVRRRDTASAAAGYESPLPCEIPYTALGKPHTIPFYVSDDPEDRSHRLRQILLKINIDNVVSGDVIAYALNGESLSTEKCIRSFGGLIDPYQSQWLEFHLERVRPRKGWNELLITVEKRAEGLEGALTVNDVEVIAEYGPYPSEGSGPDG